MTGDRRGDDAGGGLREAVSRRSSPWQALAAVAWSFFGVRRSVDHERDVTQLNPLHVIVAGLVAAALFVAALVLLVQWVVA
ncbi:DUF2970 domain-containing protein [Aquabacterium sp. J223]|uniref:DUF2970 domain-containing protein n=1 Tax=Aquabacterium sp. J223 TaxID=2898431 RepID=UPI0021AE2D92|nr:DUF2970 domain-containing protein [Aquabacterium sp. J223]UUX95681.1 DUF2970 domain-containing protein [Aquabacterium sp. J223]